MTATQHVVDQWWHSVQWSTDFNVKGKNRHSLARPLDDPNVNWDWRTRRGSRPHLNRRTAQWEESVAPLFSIRRIKRLFHERPTQQRHFEIKKKRRSKGVCVLQGSIVIDTHRMWSWNTLLACASFYFLRFYLFQSCSILVFFAREETVGSCLTRPALDYLGL